MDRAKVAEFLRVFRLAYNRGLICGTEGNGSLRCEEGIYITRSRVSKGLMEPEDVLLIDQEGRVVEGSGKPSSELPMHLKLYGELPHLRAIVHTHPPFSTAYTLLKERFPLEAMSEMFISSKGVAFIPYALPSSEELAEKVALESGANDLFLLARHGVVALGDSLLEAYLRTEALEESIKVMMIARSVGEISLLAEEEIAKLKRLGEAIFGHESD